jgi:alcohol dehydrogenase (cytochrome c)
MTSAPPATVAAHGTAPRMACRHPRATGGLSLLLNIWPRALALILGTSTALSSCKPVTTALIGHHTVVTDSLLLSAATQPSNWLMFGGNYDNTRYVTLTQFDSSTIAHLKPVQMHEVGVRWQDRLGIGWRQGESKRWYRPQGWHPRAWGNEKQLSTPIAVDGILYYTGAYDVVVAVDVRSGKELWRVHYRMQSAPLLCCGPSNRGLAVFGNSVLLATLDARLIALDRATGNERWNVEIANPAKGYSETMAPLVVNGLVIVGASGAEFGIRGLVEAFDAETGRMVWRFWTIPSPADGGWWGKWAKTTPEGDPLPRSIAAEKADSAKYPDSWQHGGGSVWMTPAYDAQLGLLFLGVGNPAPVLDDTPRPGDNLYTASIVALDAKTGTLRWYYQFLPHDMWDTDAQSPPVLFDVERNGVQIPAVGLASETGWVYILDRRTGTRILRSDPFVPQREMFLRPTAAGAVMYPAVTGGASWPPPAFSPKTKLLYVLGQHHPIVVKLVKGSYKTGGSFIGGETSDPENGGDDKAFGTLTSIDVNTGRIRWQHRTTTPLAYSGALATASGLVFYGDNEGFLNAIDAETGRLVRRISAGAPIEGPPISFTVDDRPYLAAVTRSGLLILGL